MTSKSYRGISLSAGAVLNGWPMPKVRAATTPGRGDFAEREGGRIRRKERRAKNAARWSWMQG